MPENLINRLEKWNEQAGYRIEEVISGLGYKVSDDAHLDEMHVFYFEDSSRNRGKLIISPAIAPIFFIESKEGKRESVIIFGKTLQMNEFISLPSKDLGAVELGIDRLHPNKMKFYSEAKRRYRFLEDTEHKESVLPDEIRTLNNTEPLQIISEVRYWAAEIRRNLAPKYDIVLSNK